MTRKWYCISNLFYKILVTITDGEEDGEIELATAVLTPISQKVIDENPDDPLLFIIAHDVSAEITAVLILFSWLGYIAPSIR